MTLAYKLKRGNVMLLSLIFLSIFVAVGTALMSYLTVYARSERSAISRAQAKALAEAGMDKAIYEMNLDSGYYGETDTPLGAGLFSVAISEVDLITKEISVTAYVPNKLFPSAIKTIRAQVMMDSSIVSFRFGVQVGEGGIILGNNSEISGNLYSNGSVTGSNGSAITGDVTAVGTVTGPDIGGSAWAYKLSNCDIGGNAIYQIISNCDVAGSSTATTSAPLPEPMPISDGQIDSWEEKAASGGTISGNYTINDSQEIGPKKIDGDLIVNGTLTMSGPIWVKGDITFGNNASLTVAASASRSGTMIIADYPGSEATKGRISLANNMIISGNGNIDSFPMVLSMNTGGTAIQMSNNANSVILYAPNGTVLVSNNGKANQITARTLSLENNSNVEYVSGLISQTFTSGPGGSWVFVPGTYETMPW